MAHHVKRADIGEIISSIPPGVNVFDGLGSLVQNSCFVHAPDWFVAMTIATVTIIWISSFVWLAGLLLRWNNGQWWWFRTERGGYWRLNGHVWIPVTISTFGFTFGLYEISNIVHRGQSIRMDWPAYQDILNGFSFLPGLCALWATTWNAVYSIPEGHSFEFLRRERFPFNLKPWVANMAFAILPGVCLIPLIPFTILTGVTRHSLVLKCDDLADALQEAKAQNKSLVQAAGTLTKLFNELSKDASVNEKWREALHYVFTVFIVFLLIPFIVSRTRVAAVLWAERRRAGSRSIRSFKHLRTSVIYYVVLTIAITVAVVPFGWASFFLAAGGGDKLGWDITTSTVRVMSAISVCMSVATALGAACFFWDAAHPPPGPEHSSANSTTRLKSSTTTSTGMYGSTTAGSGLRSTANSGEGSMERPRRARTDSHERGHHAPSNRVLRDPFEGRFDQPGQLSEGDAVPAPSADIVYQVVPQHRDLRGAPPSERPYMTTTPQGQRNELPRFQGASIPMDARPPMTQVGSSGSVPRLHTVLSWGTPPPQQAAYSATPQSAIPLSATSPAQSSGQYYPSPQSSGSGPAQYPARSWEPPPMAPTTSPQVPYSGQPYSGQPSGFGGPSPQTYEPQTYEPVPLPRTSGDRRRSKPGGPRAVHGRGSSDGDQPPIPQGARPPLPR